MIIACIPAYNKERTIGSVVVRAMRFVDRVVVCDDGSGDLTGAIAGGLGAVVVRHERNMGKGAALRTAFRCARDLEPDVVVMLDGDSQHDPGEFSRLVEPVVGGEAEPFMTRVKQPDSRRAERELGHRITVPLEDRIPRTIEGVRGFVSREPYAP